MIGAFDDKLDQSRISNLPLQSRNFINRKICIKPVIWSSAGWSVLIGSQVRNKQAGSVAIHAIVKEP